jgi:hypothetical protein
MSVNSNADVTQALRDAENALRDFIASQLQSALGPDWEDQSGVSQERLAKWKDRREVERKRQEAGATDERLIYYADFFDLRTILKKHWDQIFSQALGDWKTLDVYLSDLERLRDPDAHRRELLPHQKSLAIGISGEIRTRIVRYRSKKETDEDCFPRIESARDSLGNIWVPGQSSLELYTVSTKTTLRPDDQVDFVVTARDPEDLPVAYALEDPTGKQTDWQESGVFNVRIGEPHIGKLRGFSLLIRSPRTYHAEGNRDGSVRFLYRILPK